MGHERDDGLDAECSPIASSSTHSGLSWSHGDRRAPHKPLLLLIALARLQRGEARWLHFSEIEEPFRELLREFGPGGAGGRLVFPFWRLRNDGVCEVLEADELFGRQNAAVDVSITVLRTIDARGGLREDLCEHRRAHP